MKTQVFYLSVRQVFQRILTGWMFILLQVPDRIVKTVTDLRGTGDYTDYAFAAEFSIK